MPISSVLSTGAQALSLLLISLVVGSMFGIWRGYDFAQYTPATYLEVHQGSVRGLNLLLPALAIATLVLVVGLAISARGIPGALWLYVAAALLIVAGGLITRFVNQPINDQIMAWSATALPADWTSIRDVWRNAHLARLGATFAAELLLILAIFAHRG